MSRSASLCINLLLTSLEVNNIKLDLDANGKSYKVIEMTQAVENEYTGSPCGALTRSELFFLLPSPPPPPPPPQGLKAAAASH